MYLRFSKLMLLLLLLCSIPLQSWAGSCEKTSRKAAAFANGEARTRVKNETSAMTLHVELLRGDSKKSSQFIKPGEAFSNLAKFTWTKGQGDFTVQLYPDTGKWSSACKYTIKKGENYMEWLLADGETEVCPDNRELNISCEKSYNKDKLRYTTTFIVSDSQ